MSQIPKVRLCRITFEFAPTIGGSITHTIEVAKRMAPYCARQFVIVPHTETDTTELDAGFPFEVHRVRYHNFAYLRWIKAHFLKRLPVAPLVNFSFGLAALRKCLALNRECGLDVIHAHGIGVGPAAVIAGKVAHKPVIWTLDGSLIAYSKLSAVYETIIARIFHPKAILVADDGSTAVAKFQRLFPTSTQRVVHAIDTDFYRPTPFPEDHRAALRVGKDDFVTLSAHALLPVKGVHHVINAFASMRRQAQSDRLRLLIAGDGPLRGELERLARELGTGDNVIFLGGVDKYEMPRYYSLADICTATSVYSNANLSVQEAMSCERPVVAFDSGGTGSVITNEETGLLAKNGDVEDFSGKLIRLYREPELRARLGNHARAFIVANRGWDKRIATELEAYCAVLGLPRHPSMGKGPDPQSTEDLSRPSHTNR
jgi:glycosyltransferase involved in cell wall biosynthesis